MDESDGSPTRERGEAISVTPLAHASGYPMCENCHFGLAIATVGLAERYRISL